MQEVLFTAYLVILICQIVFLVWCARHRSRVGWVLLYLLEAASAVAAFVLMTHFDNLPGYGMMPGLTYFGETLFSLFAFWAYVAMLVITVIINIVCVCFRKTLGRSHPE